VPSSVGAVSDPVTEAPTVELLDLADLSRIELELTDVARALERLDEGTYGTCETCAAQLPDDVLEAEPAARFCQQHTPA
jgi:RNA polymerase-binding transcription factor DksA